MDLAKENVDTLFAVEPIYCSHVSKNVGDKPKLVGIHIIFI